MKKDILHWFVVVLAALGYVAINAAFAFAMMHGCL